MPPKGFAACKVGTSEVNVPVAVGMTVGELKEKAIASTSSLALASSRPAPYVLLANGQALDDEALVSVYYGSSLSFEVKAFEEMEEIRRQRMQSRSQQDKFSIGNNRQKGLPSPALGVGVKRGRSAFTSVKLEQKSEESKPDTKLILRRSLSKDSSSSHQQAPDAVLPLVYGSVAQWLGEKAAPGKSHQWTVYVRGIYNEDIIAIVEKVVFILHQSFDRPMREVTTTPFEVTEFGWGVFQIGIRIYLRGIENFVEVSHMLAFSKAVPPLHSIPPLGRPLQKEEFAPFILHPKPYVSETRDEIVFKNPSDALMSAIRIHKIMQTPSQARGVSCWDVIKAYGNGGESEVKVAKEVEELTKIRDALVAECGELEREVELNILQSTTNLACPIL